MIVFAREVFVCTCSTNVASPPVTGDKEAPRFRQGTIADLARLNPARHNREHISELRDRLDRGEYWLIGENNGDIVTYTWLHRHNKASYPSLPGCDVWLDARTGYGYDAWTPPELRGNGYRRHAFVQELRVLAKWGLHWEASFFVKHQLDGAIRSLATAGIEVVPQWRISLTRDRALTAEKLRNDTTVRPTWLPKE